MKNVKPVAPSKSGSGVETLYAFWNYDTYPYFLCGTVAKMDDDGLVSIKEYGFARFKPVLILPVNAGKRLQKKLDFLRDTYQSELRIMRRTAEERLLNHIPELADTRKKR